MFLWHQIRKENPRLARDSKILRVTMDNVYEVGRPRGRECKAEVPLVRSRAGMEGRQRGWCGTGAGIEMKRRHVWMLQGQEWKRDFPAMRHSAALSLTSCWLSCGAQHLASDSGNGLRSCAHSFHLNAFVQVFTTPRDITGLQVRCSRVPGNANCAWTGLLGSSRYTPRACICVQGDTGA